MQNHSLQAALDLAKDEHLETVQTLENSLIRENAELTVLRLRVEELEVQQKLLKDYELRIQSLNETIAKLEAEQAKLIGRNKEVTGVADFCMDKLQRVLDERPLFIERRTVVSSIGEFLRGGTIQRLGQALGFTEEEKAALTPRDNLTDAFVEFLHK
jgi:hypothetical protein